MTNENRRMSAADRAGLAARSPEGHAARSMGIKGREEDWIRIQANTFCNWLNVNLADKELNSVTDLETDLQSGVILVNLVEKLQKRKIRHNKKPINQHQELENISIALDAVQDDGIKLVNIGNSDIHHGNLKLILGLIWSLIAHYQLGASNFPPKKLILAWLKAILPDCNIKNFTSDWNNGIYLSALLDYCKPGLLPDWKKLNPSNGLKNCQRAMEIAERHFNIPMVLAPEYMASPNLDELSGMTYFSYFLKEEDSPGYYATLEWVKTQVPHERVNNFRTDWNDGFVASSLVKSKGGPIPGYENMKNNPEHWISNLETALIGGQKIGVTPVMEARDMANPNVEYLGVMSWAAQFQWITNRTAPGDRLQIKSNVIKPKVGEECNFKMDILDETVHPDSVTAEIIGPSGPIFSQLEFTSGQGGIACFQPNELGIHKILVRNEGELVKGSPYYTRVMPLSKKDYDGIEPCAVESTVEVLINPHHAAKPKLLEVTSISPTKRQLKCPINEENGTFYASFMPDEAGEWNIHVTYNDEDIENSPFKCMVYDPRTISVTDQDAAKRACPGEPFTFTVDASMTGYGEVAIDVVFENESLRRKFHIKELNNRIYQVTFTPRARGKHKVYVYLHGIEVKGSPFPFKIGKDLKDKSKPSLELFKSNKRVSRYKTFEEQRLEDRRNHFIEKEIPIITPAIPPRSKKEKSLQNTKDFDNRNQQTAILFDSEHQTDDGLDLLPIKRKIEFDCPFFSEDSHAIRADDIFVEIKDSKGKNCYTNLKINNKQSFTCDFTTSVVGKHEIQIIIKGQKLNCTPSFFTYDSSKVTIEEIPPGYVGCMSEFEINQNGAGPGNVEVKVNNGHVTSHVFKKTTSKYHVSFTPYELGRHRIDVTFNGEKIPYSPWFLEVKESNTHLTSPSLVTGKTNINTSTLSGFDEMPDHSKYNNYKTYDINTISSDIKRPLQKEMSSSPANSNYIPLRASISPLNTSSTKTNKSILEKEKQDSNKVLNSKSAIACDDDDTSYNNQVYRQFSNNKDIKKLNKRVSESAPNLLIEGCTENVCLLENNENVFTTAKKNFGKCSMLLTPSLLQKTNNTNEMQNLITKEISDFSNKLTSNITKSSLTNKSVSSSISTSKHHYKYSLNDSEEEKNYIPALYSTTISKMIKNPDPDVEISAQLYSPKEVSLTLSKVNSIDGQMKNSSTTATIKDLDNTSTNDEIRDINNQFNNKINNFCPSFTEQEETSLQNKHINSQFFGKTDAHSSSSYTYSGNSQELTKQSRSHLNDYTDMVDFCIFDDEIIKHFKAGKVASFTLKAPGHKKEDITINIISPERRSDLSYKVIDEGNNQFCIEFITAEVGTYAIDVIISGSAAPKSPLIAKVYDPSLIKVTDIADGIKGIMSTFKVDASKAGEGQLEISINEGDVPNSVQVIEGGKCLVTYTPEQSITHEIEVTFNDEQVPGSPFLCRIAEGDIDHNYEANDKELSRISVALDHLALIPVSCASQFKIKVADGDDAELAVSVQGPSDDVPVKVTGSVKNGFTAEFFPQEVGIHLILVEYNGIAVGGTPFYSKAYDPAAVTISDIPKSSPGKIVTFAVDASNAGDGNLEIFVQSKTNFRFNFDAGYSLLTDVEALGNARFNVSFTPEDHADHIIYVTFNDYNIPGSPFISKLMDIKNVNNSSKM